MSLIKAKDYIKELHRRQENPYLWPDYLTGLPDKAAIIHRLGEVYPRLGRTTLAYVRVINVHPFLLKYGADRHAEIVQWSAAILKTVADSHGRNNFVGALRTHDFVLIARTDRIDAILKEAVTLFRRKVRRLYSDEDLGRGFTISFKRGSEEVQIGLMKMIYVTTRSAFGIPRGRLIPALADLCDELEAEGADSKELTAEHADLSPIAG